MSSHEITKKTELEILEAFKKAKAICSSPWVLGKMAQRTENTGRWLTICSRLFDPPAGRSNQFPRADDHPRRCRLHHKQCSYTIPRRWTSEQLDSAWRAETVSLFLPLRPRLTSHRIVRVLLFIPVFTITAFFSVWFYPASGFLVPIGEWYEGFGITALFLFYVAALEPNETRRADFFHNVERRWYNGKKKGDGGSLRWFRVRIHQLRVQLIC